MNLLNLRAGFSAVTLALVVSSAGPLAAQPPGRRAASPAALLAYPGFFQGQPVVVRGTLATRDQAVLISPAIDRSIPLFFNGPSPIDGPVEIRATFWDVGRFQPDDPRVQSLGLSRLLRNGSEGDWPRPGEVVALIVTDAMSVGPVNGPPTLRLIALDPTSYVGSRVTITGQFHGRNLYGELPQGPGLSQWDFVLKAADASLWVTGFRPRGKGFNLNVGARVDTGNWLETTGVVKEAHGLVWIEAQRLSLAKPDVEPRNAETPPVQLMGPPPEVIFSDPEEGETGVRLKTLVRVQFSRDMNPESFKGRVHWRYGSPPPGVSGVDMADLRISAFSYDQVKRALEVRIDTDEMAQYRNVVVELGDGIAATDGAQMKPWAMTFTLGGP